MPSYIVVAVVVFSAVAVAGLYVRYALSPEAGWKRRLARAVGAADRRRRDATAEAKRLQAQWNDDLAKRRAAVIDQLCAGTDVSALAEYPGIGDATVARLHDAGFRNVYDVRRADLRLVNGLGAARLRDLLAAVQRLSQTMAARATNHADPVVRQNAAAWAAKDNQTERRIDEQKAAAAGAGRTLDWLQADRATAGRVTFWRHVFRFGFPRLTPEQLAQPFEPPVTVHTPAPPPPIEPKPDTTGMPVAQVAPADGPPPATEVLRAVARFGLAVAKADGRVAVSERKQLALFLDRRFAGTPDEKAAVPALAATEATEIPTVAEALADVKRLVRPARYSDLYQMACAVADAAGERNAREIAVLAEVKAALTPPDAEGPQSMVRSAASSVILPVPMTDQLARDTLGIEAGVPLSADLIRRQFRLLSERYNDTRFSGTDAEFARLAEAKRKSLRRAAEWLIKSFGEPLDSPTTTQPPPDDRHNPDLDAVFGD